MLNRKEVKKLHLLGEFSSGQEAILEEGLSGQGLRVDRIKRADEADMGSIIAVRSGRIVPRQIMESLEIPFVISGGTGTGNIENWEGRQTLVDNCRGGNGIEVAAHAVAMLAAVDTEILEDARSSKLETFAGVVGAGGVGTQIGLLLRQLNLPVILGRHPSHIADEKIGVTNLLDRVLSQPVVFIAAGSKNIINDENVDLLKNTQTIINIGRADAISESVLEKILNGNVRYLTDVWIEEPGIGENVPASVRALLKRGVIGTMHEAAQQETANTRIAMMIEKKIKRFLDCGKPLEAIDPLNSYRRLLVNGIANCPLADFKSIREVSDVERVCKLIDYLNLHKDDKEWMPLHLDPHPSTASMVTTLNRLNSI